MTLPQHRFLGVHEPLGSLYHARMPGGMFPGGLRQCVTRSMQAPGYVAIVLGNDSRFAHHPAGRETAPEHPETGTEIHAGDGKAAPWSWIRRNYNGKGWIATNVAAGRIKGIPISEALHVVEALHTRGRGHDSI